MSTNPTGIPGIFTPNLTQVLNAGVQDKLITQSASAKLLQQAQRHSFIQGTSGPDPNKLSASRVVVGGVAIDDSGSMRPNRQAVILGSNEMIGKMERSQERRAILLNLMAIRSTPAHLTSGFRPLFDKDLPAGDPANATAVKQLTEKDITTGSGTALYDTVYELIGASLAYGMPLYRNGQLNKIVIAVFTDGNDEHSQHHKPDDIKELIEGVRNRERIMMMYFGFVSPGYDPDSYLKTAKSMGFDDSRGEIVLANTINPQLLGERFGFVSDTMISTSQMVVQAPAQAIQSQAPATAQQPPPQPLGGGFTF